MLAARSSIVKISFKTSQHCPHVCFITYLINLPNSKSAYVGGPGGCHELFPDASVGVALCLYRFKPCWTAPRVVQKLSEMPAAAQRTASFYRKRLQTASSSKRTSKRSEESHVGKPSEPPKVAQETLFLLAPQDSSLLVLCPITAALSGSPNGLDNFQITCQGLLSGFRKGLSKACRRPLNGGQVRRAVCYWPYSCPKVCRLLGAARSRPSAWPRGQRRRCAGRALTATIAYSLQSLSFYYPYSHM